MAQDFGIFKKLAMHAKNWVNLPRAQLKKGFVQIKELQLKTSGAARLLLQNKSSVDENDLFSIGYALAAILIMLALIFTSISLAQILGALLTVYVIFATFKWVSARKAFAKIKGLRRKSLLAQDYGILKRAMAHRKTFKNYSRAQIQRAFAQVKELQGKTGEAAKSILAEKGVLLESDLFRIVAIITAIVIMFLIMFTAASLYQIFGFLVTALMIFTSVKWMVPRRGERK